MDGAQPAVVLLDGVTGGTWRATRERGTAVLTIRPFDTVPAADVDALTAEGVRLLSFLEAGATDRDIRILPPA